MKKTLFSFLLLCFVAFGYSQVTTSNIKGLILDENGDPLPGANVVAVHTPTGTKYGAATNFDGRYSILNMRVGGPYSVTITYVGYQDKVYNDVFLVLGKTQNINYQMVQNAEELDAVVITGSNSGVFGSDRTGAETNVGRREITRLPTISRSASDFTRLEPSSTGNSFGGRNDQYNNFSLDGSIFNNPFGLDSPTPGGQTGAQPISLDAIDQIQVALAPYDVTQSGFTGASVNAVTKSGTNEFHGTVYGFFRNEGLTGKKVDGEDVLRPDLEQNQFGFSIGGPIVKDKLFFFANFEKDQRTDLGTNGFFAGTNSGAPGESRVLESDFQLVDNILRQVVIGQDANGDDMFYNPGRYEGFTYDSNSTKGIFKLDWNINDKNRLAIIYNFLEASREQPAHPTALGFRGPGPNQLQFENTGYEINNNLDSFQLELNSDLGNGISNKFQLGYTHFDDFRNALSSPAPTITILNEGSNYIIGGHEPFSINNRLDQKVFQFNNNTNIVKGNHTFTVGFSFEKFQFDNSFNLGAYGAQGVFFPTGDIQSFRDTVGDPGAEAALVGFYQGLFNAAIAADSALNAAGTGNPGGWALAETNVGQLAFYLQDEWNVNENFKLTYGVRFDRPLYFDTAEKIRENIDRKGGPFDPGTFTGGTYQPTINYFDPDTGATVNLDSEQLPSNDFLISPRLGINWDVNGNNKTQVRGGTGLFTGRFPFVWLGNQVQGVDFFFYQLVDPDFQWPQVWRSNLGVDHRLENGITLSADLSYTKDINGAHVQNWALNNPSGTLQGVDNRPVYEASDIAVNAFGGPTNAYVFTNSDKGRIWNATLKGQKTFDNGLFTSLAYNYLNAKDVNSIEAEITGDAFAGNAISGNANDDVLSYSRYGDTHRIIGVASKKFSYGKDKFATTISTFFEYAQGARFSYTYGGDLNGDGSNFNDLLYIPTASEVQQMQFAEAGMADAFEAYIQQDDYLSDNRGSYAERYGALAPWRGRWDIKILQDFNFKVGKETHTLQLSADVLNVGNLINSDWGVVEVPNSIQPLGVSVDENNVPTYTFNGDLTQTFSSDVSLLSRWQAQFGVRYIF
ncbi:carboxypeptidase regulatory-like domain-containing protein [Winogradskyella sp. 3972H.M.0a.05]|uniref:TonB-dependent receptor n=1 Tax=Winogradskyella sp. 3972H.M.0a.05 TaxID=2950277 RepID=UPI0033981D8D